MVISVLFYFRNETFYFAISRISSTYFIRKLWKYFIEAPLALVEIGETN